MARCNVCDVCDKGYATKQGLKRHMETHTETQKHTCEICSAKFSYYHMHREHMHHHNDENHTHILLHQLILCVPFVGSCLSVTSILRNIHVCICTHRLASISVHHAGNRTATEEHY